MWFGSSRVCLILLIQVVQGFGSFWCLGCVMLQVVSSEVEVGLPFKDEK